MEALRSPRRCKVMSHGVTGSKSSYRFPLDFLFGAVLPCENWDVLVSISGRSNSEDAQDSTETLARQAMSHGTQCEDNLKRNILLRPRIETLKTDKKLAMFCRNKLR